MIPPGCNKEAIVSGIIEDDKLNEVYLEELENPSRLNQIYVGKVQNIVKNINAAFIEFEKDCVGYYPLEELPTAIFTKKQGKKPLVIGDELLVQVAKEPVKTKAAVLTTNLSFPGKYFVITTGKKGIGLSGKLTDKDKERWKVLVEEELKKYSLEKHNTEKAALQEPGVSPMAVKEFSYGIIVRTNTRDASKEQLVEELHSMLKNVDETLKKAQYRTVFSRITEGNHEYLTLLRNAYIDQMEQILTDCPDIYENISKYLQEEQPHDSKKLTFYEDKLLPMKKLYNLELQLEHAQRKHIWLKSGAYLIIEQTEAFSVIDVNTGKFDGKKKKKDTFVKINLEAAKEAARQIRLRNLSGIILVDFINMTEEEDKQKLMKEFAEYVRPDRVKTMVVDMTVLGIVEVTRKKERSSLSEVLQHFL